MITFKNNILKIINEDYKSIFTTQKSNNILKIYLNTYTFLSA